MQVTGRDNYKQVGYEANPAALAEPGPASDTAAAFWENNGLNDQTATVLDRKAFDEVSRTVNGGTHGQAALGRL